MIYIVEYFPTVKNCITRGILVKRYFLFISLVLCAFFLTTGCSSIAGSGSSSYLDVSWNPPVQQTGGGITYTFTNKSNQAIKLTGRHASWYTTDGKLLVDGADYGNDIVIKPNSSTQWGDFTAFNGEAGNLAKKLGQSRVLLYLTFKGTDDKGNAVQVTAKVPNEFR